MGWQMNLQTFLLHLAPNYLCKYVLFRQVVGLNLSGGDNYLPRAPVLGPAQLH
jgi:hypothetical protein